MIIGRLTEGGAVLDERLRDLLNVYADVKPEAAPAGYEHRPVAHGASIPWLVQAGAAVRLFGELADESDLEVRVELESRCLARRAAGEVNEDDLADFYERLERLLRAARAGGDPLAAVETADYVRCLTGREPNGGHKIRCPFHADGEERTPSLHLYDNTTWACFGCGKGGDIYNFGSWLWLGKRSAAGGEFLRLRARLRDTVLPPPPSQGGE